MIRFKTVLNNVGKIILIVDFALVLPLMWSLLSGGPDLMAFVWSFLIMAVIGLVLTFLIKPQGTIRSREGYLIVAAGWIVIVFLGSLPYVLAGTFGSYADALFEAVSGFTTTGASALTDIERLSEELLLWRSMTQWLGGLGVVVLFVALQARMDMGGVIMFKAELAGPFTDRVTAHIDDAAKIFWFMYLALTVLMMIALWLAGMPVFDAVCHSFSAMATGGFSTKNAGLAAFDSTAVITIVTIFMFIAGTNFALLYRAVIKRDARFFRNEEFRLYCAILLIVTLIVFANVNLAKGSAGIGFGDALFTVVAQMTTTGFTYIDYDAWPRFANMLILMLMMIGACYSSTSGSLKTGVYLLVFKNFKRVMFGMLHPQALTEVKINGKVVKDSILNKALQYFILFMVTMFLGAILLAMTGLPFQEALTGAMAAITNNGPAAGALGPLGNYAAVSALGKYILAALMLLGRLEIYTILIVFSRAFWRQ